MDKRIVDIYDFDGTVYRGDSTADFWKFCIKKRPYILLIFPWQLIGFIFIIFNLKKIGKSIFLSFLLLIDGKKMTEQFWEANQSKMNDWFLPVNRKRETVVISASPEFLLAPICEKYKVDLLIGTRANIKTGWITGRNCRHSEKCRRLKKQMPDYDINTMYSDSKSADGPLFEMAKKRIYVKNGKRTSF